MVKGKNGEKCRKTVKAIASPDLVGELVKTPAARFP